MRKIGIIKTGRTITVNAIEPVIISMLCEASKRDFGRYSSTVPKSLENKFKIRPDGFMSKNRNDVDTIPLNIALCNLWDARTHIV